MKVYLVGGAVRDQLLGYPVKEKDWLVVGATPNALLAKGYRQVGRDFPVFLHPQSQEEYALARTERKQGTGYYGFSCDYHPKVTLEQDLARRDLTINAMAMDLNGQIIDPYGGQDDIKKRLIRHVSPSFIEDPVRVLRVARFLARYAHLGFKLADETRLLMYNMVQAGELNHLVPERVWQEWKKSLEERNPEQFIETLRTCGALYTVLPELDGLFGVPNSRVHHPEVDSGVHSLMVLKAVTSLASNPLIRFAALVHDLGKAETPMQQWPHHRQHENAGIAVIGKLCERLRIPANYRELAVMTSRFHLQIHQFFQLRPKTIVRVLEQADAFRRPQVFDAMLLVCMADARGKGLEKKISPLNYPQAEHWQQVRSICDKIDVQAIITSGKKGEAIKKALHQQRVEAVKTLLSSKNQWPSEHT